MQAFRATRKPDTIRTRLADQLKKLRGASGTSHKCRKRKTTYWGALFIIMSTMSDVSGEKLACLAG